MRATLLWLLGQHRSISPSKPTVPANQVSRCLLDDECTCNAAYSSMYTHATQPKPTYSHSSVPYKQLKLHLSGTVVIFSYCNVCIQSDKTGRAHQAPAPKGSPARTLPSSSPDKGIIKHSLHDLRTPLFVIRLTSHCWCVIEVVRQP